MLIVSKTPAYVCLQCSLGMNYKRCLLYLHQHLDEQIWLWISHLCHLLYTSLCVTLSYYYLLLMFFLTYGNLWLYYRTFISGLFLVFPFSAVWNISWNKTKPLAWIFSSQNQVWEKSPQGLRNQKINHMNPAWTASEMSRFLNRSHDFSGEMTWRGWAAWQGQRCGMLH